MQSVLGNMFKWKKGVCTENLTYQHQVKKKYENNLDMEKYSNGVLSLKNLTKRFGTNVVLDNISLTIGRVDAAKPF